MPDSRRDFLRGFAAVTVGAAAVAPAGAAPTPQAAVSPDKTPRWAMVVDVAKCIGCQSCTVSCIYENAVPEDSFRTIVSTYEVQEGDRAAMVMLPRLCNHCADAPCIPVCPVGATFQRADGIVVVDADRCVGCAYCVQACPYDARFVNHGTQKADKCTFCAHRVEAGLLPACVESCVGGARIFGDLDDPKSTVSKLVAKGDAKVLKPELGTRPHVFYLGLDDRLTGKVEGEPTLWHPTGRETHA
ncbi:4Fe-4S dicluster domain-containing protein [Rhodoplanes sp. TEM]|uniref:4Fe-4S dicluster domain-containing protein n=1 Tax=Rhodoplanes tepidamans TaxID=200616 RepID=A0ABT5JCK1_RHOTP|nr:MULTISPECIES: 4Fe-4S dicluster domain-containing protein [Rhodoplanes]MDC7787222.1 4Fe-4S dicluster domain-containing protein [Rhodoplanes tepidamans]MDC7986764.1 4Fe-4S dicluster domain-containing protein [Rhodoplanes sp. TEM]MDQ0357756.1 tetrathionate reductase subunit B [Rhodoplanes tepidamans]